MWNLKIDMPFFVYYSGLKYHIAAEKSNLGRRLMLPQLHLESGNLIFSDQEQMKHFDYAYLTGFDSNSDHVPLGV